MQTWLEPKNHPEKDAIITPRQCRARRAWLDWSLARLAYEIGNEYDRTRISQFECSTARVGRRLGVQTLTKIKEALDKAGAPQIDP